VIWRKICFGTHSEEGSRFVERILTVHATLKQQNRNVVDFITRASEAFLHGRKAPSLLPDRVLLRSVG
jgi:transposase